MPKTKLPKPKPKKSTSKKTPTNNPKKLDIAPARIDNVLVLSQQSLKTIANNWITYLIILIFYFVVSLVIVEGLGTSINISYLKQLFQSGHISNGLSTSLSTLSIIFGNSSSGTSTSFAQPILLVITSLILIWVIRGSVNKHKVKVRDAVYKSLAPLIPFSLIFLLMAVELIPLIFGSYLINEMLTNSLATNIVEQAIFFVIAVALIVLSIYLLIPSLFSIYIVTLPDVLPMQALRSAWKLVKKHRSLLLRKVLFLLLALLILNAIITLVLVLLVSSVSGLVYFGLSIICLVFFHSYMYNLYREML